MITVTLAATEYNGMEDRIKSLEKQVQDLQTRNTLQVETLREARVHIQDLETQKVALVQELFKVNMVVMRNIRATKQSIEEMKELTARYANEAIEHGKLKGAYDRLVYHHKLTCVDLSDALDQIGLVKEVVNV